MAVADEIAGPIGGAREKIRGIEEEVFRNAFPDREFLESLEADLGDRINSLHVFNSVLCKELEMIKESEGILREMAENMVAYLLDFDHPVRKASLSSTYEDLEKALAALGVHFGFIEEDPSPREKS